MVMPVSSEASKWCGAPNLQQLPFLMSSGRIGIVTYSVFSAHSLIISCTLFAHSPSHFLHLSLHIRCKFLAIPRTFFAHSLLI